MNETFMRVLKKYRKFLLKASWQKRGFAKLLESLKEKARFNDSPRPPGARACVSGCYKKDR
ncbi:hypothetical protein LJC15_02220, partial [Desulfovibrio sp. OttesenSCG-928-G11]|nr:hypothetical protein [Desulfovibrio sp. OttesenSCG-928-G11]